MEYIVHHRYREISLLETDLNLPRGTVLVTMEEYPKVVSTLDGIPVCFITSENFKMHIARNDDGNGLERGDLTYEIAYSNRKNYSKLTLHQQRFTDSEILILTQWWSKYLRDDSPMVLFNDKFFAADIDQLKLVAKDLKIDVGKILKYYDMHKKG